MATIDLIVLPSSLIDGFAGARSPCPVVGGPMDYLHQQAELVRIAPDWLRRSHDRQRVVSVR